MPVHPDTPDGYFEAGDPLTGNRPAGAFPSLEFFNALLDLLDDASTFVTINASGAVPLTRRPLSIDTSSGDINLTLLAADNPAAQKITLHREDATNNKINLLVEAGTICRMDSYEDALTGQDETLTLAPKASTANWVKI